MEVVFQLYSFHWVNITPEVYIMELSCHSGDNREDTYVIVINEHLIMAVSRFKLDPTEIYDVT